MIEIQRLRAQHEAIAERLQARNLPDAAGTVARILAQDEHLRSTLVTLERLQQQMNQSSKSIGALMAQGKKAEAEAAKAQTAAWKEEIKQLEQQAKEAEEARQALLVTLPNPNHASVPAGKSSEDNVTVYQNDRSFSFDFAPLPHWELAVKHNLISWELGNKITGAGFPVYLGKGAALQRALISFFLDQAAAAGYSEVLPPLMVNADSGFGTGQLPDKEGQMYHVTLDELYLIPTAEVPITNLYRDVILEENELPVKHMGYSACFRREAGSYGAHVRGLNRLHQFDKVEIVQIAHPDRSYEILEEMCAYVQGLLEQLGLQYRKLLLCSGDTGFASAKTYDMEVWSPGQDRWLEVSSVSNFESFQSNRLKLRFRDANRKTQLAHTLNGSALALPRIVAGILESYQQADGSILVPEVLQRYTGFDRIG